MTLKLSVSLRIAPDGYTIILYGGFNSNNAVASPDLLTLNITSEQYVWTSWQTNNPPTMRHTAAIYGSYMFVMFGESTATHETTNSISILDLTNHNWVTQTQTSGVFPPPPPPQTTSSAPAQTTQNNSGK